MVASIREYASQLRLYRKMKRHKNPAWPQIEQALTDLEKQELVRLLQQLCDVSDDAYRFVLARFRVGQKLQTRIAPYRAVIGQRFSFRHDVPPDLDFGLVNKTIHDYRQATDDIEGVLSLQLCCIEKATSFMSQFGIPDALFFQELAENCV